MDTSGAEGGAAVSSNGGELKEGADIAQSSVQGSAERKQWRCEW